MKKSPASIEQNANETNKESTMNQNTYRITDCLTDITGNDLDALIEKATAKRWHGKLTIWNWNGRQWKYVRAYTF